MPLSEAFVSEVSAAVESLPAQVPGPEAARPAEGGQAAADGKPAPETVVELEEEAEETGEIDGATDEEVGESGSKDGEDDSRPGDSRQDDSASAAQKPAVVIGDELLTEAVLGGLDLDVARQFPSEDALRRVLHNIRKTADEPAEAEEDPLANLPKLDPNTYEPEVIKTFDALVGVVRKQQEAIRQFQAQSEQMARSGQEAAAQEVERWFDEQVAKLGSDLSDALGSGAYRTLDRGGSQFAKREAIATQVAVLLGGYKAAGKVPPPRDEVFDAAARIVLKDEFEQLREKKLAGELAKRSTQHIQRAGGQKAKTNQDPLEATAALIDQKFFGK